MKIRIIQTFYVGQKLIQILFFFFFFICPQLVIAQIYQPYSVKNPDRLDASEGYCQNSNQEKKLWYAILKTAKTIDEKLPNIPPEQIRYINSELKSTNPQRVEAIFRVSIFTMRSIKDSLINIINLTEGYLSIHDVMRLSKKVEYAARIMVNLDSLHNNFNYMSPENFQSSLATREYFVSIDTLKQVSDQVPFSVLKYALAKHLICYGELEK